MNINYADSCNFKPIPAITPLDGYWKNSTWKFNMSEITTGAASQPSWIDIILSGNTALTLTNALANGLNYLKLFGGTEQRNLPSGYTQVEYLQSSGEKYIDLGGVLDTSTDDVELDIQLLDNTSITNIFGARNNTTAKVYTLASNGEYWRWGWKNNSTASDVTVDLNKHVLRIDHTNNTLSLDGTVIETKGSAVSNITTPTTPTLFAIHATSGSDYYFGALKVFGFKKWTNGVLAQNLIPCRRNSDSVLGMYDTVSDTFLTNAGTGTFTAGADVVPTPDAPMDIVCNNGVVKVSKNLFDYRYFYDNYMVPSTSTVGCVAIKLLPNTNYTVSTNTQQGSTSAQVWTGSGNDVGSFTPNTGNNGVLIDSPRTIQSDSNGYIILAIRVDTDYALEESDFESGTVWVQIEQGSTATPYVPYGQIYVDGTTETVNITGKNLFDKDNNLLIGYYINKTTGQINESSDDSSSCFLNYLPSSSNITYTMSSENISGNTAMRMWAYDKDKNPISAVFNSTTVGTSISGTTPEGTAYIRCSFGTIPQYRNNIQLELGSTATTYEPYFNGGTAIAEMLLKVGTYQDVQSVINGGVTRNVGIKVLDGTEDWVAAQTSNAFYANDILDVNASLDVACYCTHFIGLTGDTPIANMNTEGSLKCGYFNVEKRVYIRYGGFANVSELTSWLGDQYANGTPVIIVYPKSSATTETVTGQPLTTQAGTNIVEITQASIDNLGLEVSFKQSTI